MENVYQRCFMSFKIGERQFATDMRDVEEVISIKSISPLTHAPELIVGHTYYKKNNLALIDLRSRLNIAMRRDRSKNFMIVVQVRVLERDLRMGVLIDEFCHLFDVKHKGIISGNPFQERMKLMSVLEMRKEEMTVLDFNTLFSMEELRNIYDTSQRIKIGGKVSGQSFEKRASFS